MKKILFSILLGLMITFNSSFAQRIKVIKAGKLIDVVSGTIPVNDITILEHV